MRLMILLVSMLLLTACTLTTVEIHGNATIYTNLEEIKVQMPEE